MLKILNFDPGFCIFFPQNLYIVCMKLVNVYLKIAITFSVPANILQVYHYHWILGLVTNQKWFKYSLQCIIYIV